MSDNTKLDKDGQPLNKRFSYSRNRERALYGLRGILQGVIADQELNDKEVLFLDTWLKSQEDLEDDGDVIDLLDAVKEVLEKGSIDKEKLEDLHTLIKDVIEYREMEEGNEGQINELIGLIAGISADNVVLDDEISGIKQWLNKNKHLYDKWPANILVKRLDHILEDGKITNDERGDLLETIKQITGQRFEDTGVAHGMTTEFFGDEISDFNHAGKCICFTGKFISGSRVFVQEVASRLGARVKNTVTKEVNVLVLGALASRDWCFSSHGRKVEVMIRRKEKKEEVIILNEERWRKFADLE